MHVTRKVLERGSSLFARQLLALSIGIVLTVGCSRDDRVAATHFGVGPGDSLATLMRHLLVANDPVKAMQLINCENLRLIASYGPQKFEAISIEVIDTVYTWKDWPARRRVERKMSNAVVWNNCSLKTKPSSPSLEPPS